MISSSLRERIRILTIFSQIMAYYAFLDGKDIDNQLFRFDVFKTFEMICILLRNCIFCASSF